MMLNTQVEGVFSNDQFTLYLTEERQVYSCGFDLRQVQSEEHYGIPRLLAIAGGVRQISVGKDHALFITATQKVYAFGSNMVGQLGVHKTTGLSYHLHPITKQKLFYAVQPIEVAHFNDQSQADSLFV